MGATVILDFLSCHARRASTPENKNRPVPKSTRARSFLAVVLRGRNTLQIATSYRCTR
jgi:hypothetical protein